MKILGIDCATRQTNVCVSDGNGGLYTFSSELARDQASKLPLIVCELLTKSNIKLSELELVAVTTGPGYYTGIRTGVAYAAALAESLGLKIIPLSGMEMFVYDLRGKSKVLAPVLKARSDSLYCAIYSYCENKFNEILSPTYMPSAGFAKTLADYPDALIVGSDAVRYPELLSLNYGIAPRPSGPAENLTSMAENHIAAAVAPETVRGKYLREPDIGPTR
ncbi:MAG: tRNA (adenosine(37)-N6)-threonylcarbamoyltransferase complex dimerization subunit type 1 TsaB [Synergistaceae bacterium]|nr:tRNA (adenosine(37)-N6)-threonylcarbamoyltransferase complex dimerization subunit type 1 TsaB [Synergistaceae bacterium]